MGGGARVWTPIFRLLLKDADIHLYALQHEVLLAVCNEFSTGSQLIRVRVRVRVRERIRIT